MAFFERSASVVCDDSRTEACPGSISFCCSKNTVCMSLDSDNNSVLCCPDSQDCTSLQPVSCDLSRQNATANPLLTLQTTDFDTPLQTCGAQCCPRGYNCQNKVCIKGASVTRPSVSSTPSSSSITTASSTPSNLTTTKTSSTNFPPVAVVVGLVVGVLAGAFMTWFVIWLLKRRRQKKHIASKLDHGSFRSGSRAPTYISDPIVATPFGGAQRADFLLQTASTKGSPGSTVITPNTLNSGSTKKRFPLFASPLKYGLPLTPKPPKRPLRSDEHLEEDKQGEKQDKDDDQAQTSQRIKDDDPLPGPLNRQDSDESHITTGSRNSSERRASTETINVGLMPPPPPVMMSREAVLSTNTTFSQMMEQAGMRRGDGFLGYPGRWSFRP